jgi:restriction system protein
VNQLPAWRTYQESAAAFFRELGMNASTDVTVEGVRTSHDVDVLVTFQHGGLDLKWVVECKEWKSSVSKVHVLALRQIVEDVGADRGILLAENGFQSGAIEATARSNVSVTSISDLRDTAAEALNRQKLLSFPLRIAQAHRNYWSISKADRIELGIRTDMDDRGYLGQLVLGAAQDVLLSALANEYPPKGLYSGNREAWKIGNLGKAVNWLEREVSELEARLNTPEAISRRRPDF